MDNIYSKLLAIRKEVSFVKVRKSGVNYPVLDGDTVLEMVGNALAKHDIVFIPSMIDAKIMYVEIKGKMVQHALATFELIFVDANTGDTFKVMTHGSGQSYDGKALGMAQTYGIKYFFYRMFLKGESDVDDEAPLPRDSEQPSPAPRQQSAPEPPSQHIDSLPPGDEPYPLTIRDVWPDVANGLLTMKVSELPEGLNVGGIIYSKIASIGYPSPEALKQTLGLESLKDWKGTLEQLMVCVLDHASEFANES